MSSNIVSYFNPVLQALSVTSGMRQCSIWLRPILNFCTISIKYRIRWGYAVAEQIFRSCENRFPQLRKKTGPTW